MERAISSVASFPSADSSRYSVPSRANSSVSPASAERTMPMSPSGCRTKSSCGCPAHPPARIAVHVDRLDPRPGAGDLVEQRLVRGARNGHERQRQVRPGDRGLTLGRAPAERDDRLAVRVLRPCAVGRGHRRRHANPRLCCRDRLRDGDRAAEIHPRTGGRRHGDALDLSARQAEPEPAASPATASASATARSSGGASARPGALGSARGPRPAGPGAAGASAPRDPGDDGGPAGRVSRAASVSPAAASRPPGDGLLVDARHRVASAVVPAASSASRIRASPRRSRDFAVPAGMPSAAAGLRARSGRAGSGRRRPAARPRAGPPSRHGPPPASRRRAPRARVRGHGDRA